MMANAVREVLLGVGSSPVSIAATTASAFKATIGLSTYSTASSSRARQALPRRSRATNRAGYGTTFDMANPPGRRP